MQINPELTKKCESCLPNIRLESYPRFLSVLYLLAGGRVGRRKTCANSIQIYTLIESLGGVGAGSRCEGSDLISLLFWVPARYADISSSFPRAHWPL